MHLVIVESPTKAKTIRKFLGPDYKVLASMGHVRDLPESSAEVPAAQKKTAWGQLGVNVADDFEPLYVIPKRKSKTVTELKAALKEADVLYLATDEDREGESISWHLLQLLKPKVPVHRMVFHEITKPAIEKALAHPREIDERLVRAQETRRILDRLVGYTLSPVLWKKIAYGLSAGRVQSSALKAIIDRERARIAFKTSSYWDVMADVQASDGTCEAKLIATEGKRIAIGKDFDETTGALKKDSESILINEERAQAISKEVKEAAWTVDEVHEKPVTRRPPPPFITSTLQQEANRKLGLSSKETMRIAQTLYEHGYITYMRTDSVALSNEAVEAARGMVRERFGAEFLPEAPRHYASSTKGAQEAHEAIRPSLALIPPHEIDLSGGERKVYELIWMRTIASQMKDSEQLQMSVIFAAAHHRFQATGLKIVFPGFLRAYVEGEEDIEGALGDRERLLPKLTVKERVSCIDARPEGHETKPPARFTEASLIQWMEKEGIGRPSTYASIIGTLVDRAYVVKQSSALAPTFTGFAVTQFMEQHFADLVNAQFTSGMEQSLDHIADGTTEWLPYLRAFYLGDQGLEKRVKTEAKSAAEDIDHRRVMLPQIPDAVVRVGKYGAYVEAPHPQHHTVVKASFPEDMMPGDLTVQTLGELLSKAQQGPTTLGQDPTSGEQIYLRTGSYGPYLQLGEDPPEEETKTKKTKKPKRVSIPKNIPLNELDYEKALLILSLPRLLGSHPQTQKEIRAGLGRFGPYIVHDGEFRSLKGEDDVFTVTLERALELLAMPKGTRGGGVSKPLGQHPKDKKPVTLHSGKFGWYVKHGKINATIPKDMKAEEITLEQAVDLLQAKKEKAPKDT